MLTFPPLSVKATALFAAYASAALLSHSPTIPTKGVSPTLFRFADPNTHRIPIVVAEDRASNFKEREFRPNH